MSLFGAPDWPRIEVDFDVPANDAAAALRAAAAAQAYSEPHSRTSQGHLRLGGEMDGANVDLTAKPYVIPGVRAGSGSLRMRVRGRISETDEGSRLSAVLSAPLPRLSVALLTGWVLFLTLTSRDLGLVFLLAGALPLAWLGLRYNQRQALRWKDDVVEFLGDLVALDTLRKKQAEGRTTPPPDATTAGEEPGG